MRLLTLRAILVATDLHDSAFAALVTGVGLARAAGASLHLLHVERDGDGSAAASLARSKLAALCERAGVGADHVTHHVRSGDPALVISAVADHVHADVIVLGPHRERESGSRALGGTAFAVVTSAGCPCLVVKSPLALPLSEVVVPIDLSDTARGALLVGLSWTSALRRTRLAAGHDASLTALHVEPPSPRVADSSLLAAVEEEIAVTREAAGTWAGVAVRGEAITNADVARGIVSFVADHAPDLVVIGTRGLGLDATGRLGSVSTSVVSSIDTPILLVPPAVWSAHIGRGVQRAAQPTTA